MPISKNRKGHDKKTAKRKLEIKQRRARAEKMYAEMMDQLSSKSLSMPDMLNKEEQMRLPGGLEQTLGRRYDVVDMPAYDSSTPIVINTPPRLILSDEEQAEQDRIQESAIITTT